MQRYMLLYILIGDSEGMRWDGIIIVLLSACRMFLVERETS